jgi:hypothetical protein
MPNLEKNQTGYLLQPLEEYPRRLFEMYDLLKATIEYVMITRTDDKGKLSSQCQLNFSWQCD